MKHWIWKTLAGWIVLWLFVLPAVLLPLGFLAQKLGDAYLREVAPQAKTQAVELLRLLASQAEGDLTPEKLVNMSQTMSDLVQRSNTSYADVMVIKDLAFIDPKGKVLAHFDVTQIARDTTSAYTSKEVLGLFDRLRRASVDVQISGLYTPELSKDPVTQALVARFMPTIRDRYPDMLAGQYTVTSSVYPVDGEVPKAGFVLTVEHHSPARVLHVFSSVFVPVILFALGVIVIVGVFYLPVLVLITARKQQAQAARIAEYENSHVDEDDLPDISAEPDFESVTPTDFDDVPLPDFLEDAPIPGPTVSTGPLYAPSEPVTGPVRVQPVPSREVPVPSMAATAARYAHSEILDAIPLDADH